MEKKYKNPYALTIGQVAMLIDSNSTTIDESAADVYQIPYDKEGKRDLNSLMTLDLREDADVKKQLFLRSKFTCPLGAQLCCSFRPSDKFQ